MYVFMAEFACINTLVIAYFVVACVMQCSVQLIKKNVHLATLD